MIPQIASFLLDAEKFDDILVVESTQCFLLPFFHLVQWNPFDCHIDPSECSSVNGAVRSFGQFLFFFIFALILAHFNFTIR